jgi:ABC-type uncharacterized transport system substrate-binding protein
MAIGIGRRQFISALGGSAFAWPLAARAQPAAIKRIGVFMNLAADDPETHARIGAFLRGLQEAGWAIGRNVQIDYRFATQPDMLAKYTAELLAFAPDVIFANANPCVQQLLQSTHDIPIVFVAVTDPVASGFVQSLSRPGGNATGFISAEFGMSGKWLELLKEIAPSLQRVVVLQDPVAGGSSMAQFAAIQAVAPPFGIELVSLMLNEPAQVEHSISDIARSSKAGLIATRTGASIARRDEITSLAAQYRLPAVYPLRLFVTAGGLISYGPDIVDECRLAASYVDRILRGEKPADLPVQTPTKYETVVNLRTAKELDLTVPQSILATADEVIE